MACQRWVAGRSFRRQQCAAEAAYMVVTEKPRRGWETQEVCAEHTPAPSASIQLIELCIPDREVT